MAEEKKIIRLADVGELEAGLKKKTWPKKRLRGRLRTSCIARASATSCPIWAICPPSTRKRCGLWHTGRKFPAPMRSVPATRCANPECGEVNPCGLKTPFCPMCGFRMEDVLYDG